MRLHTKLAEAVPAESRNSIVHGDYRIDNTIIDPPDDPTIVRAVLDWEMSTLGDPLADVAVMCVQRDPMLDLISREQKSWTAPPQMPSADDLAQRYSVVSGNSLAHWNFQMALGYFKLAIIVAGIDFRRRMSADATDDDQAGEAVAVLISRGLETFG